MVLILLIIGIKIFYFEIIFYISVILNDKCFMIADLESKNSGPRNKHEKNKNI
jgi:hypothetical protein